MSAFSNGWALIFAGAFLVAIGCHGPTGACVHTSEDKSELCVHLKKSACEQDNDKFMGGETECKNVGFPKQMANTTDGWEK